MRGVWLCERGWDNRTTRFDILFKFLMASLCIAPVLLSLFCNSNYFRLVLRPTKHYHHKYIRTHFSLEIGVKCCTLCVGMYVCQDNRLMAIYPYGSRFCCSYSNATQEQEQQQQQETEKSQEKKWQTSKEQKSIGFPSIQFGSIRFDFIRFICHFGAPFSFMLIHFVLVCSFDFVSIRFYSISSRWCAFNTVPMHWYRCTCERLCMFVFARTFESFLSPFAVYEFLQVIIYYEWEQNES